MLTSKFLPKIRHVIVDDFPETTDPWVRERHQRESLIKGLPDCKDHDIIISTDIDEIPKLEKVKAQLKKFVKPLLELFAEYSNEENFFKNNSSRLGSFLQEIDFEKLIPKDCETNSPLYNIVDNLKELLN